MTKIDPVTIETAQGKVRDMLQAAKAKLGRVPNMFGVLANAPAALETYLAMSSCLGNGALSEKVREQLALAVSNRNGCEYCVSAHSAIGKMAGLSPQDLEAARAGKAIDHKTQAILDLAYGINKFHGHRSSVYVAEARQAGLTDEEIIEVVANVALNILTNSINGLAGTEIDFPKVSLTSQAA